MTVYGVTRETYERVTRRPGSFDAFLRGLDRLLAGGLTVRLKAMALRSNKHEIPAIGDFCRARTKDYYRFDPLLHLRFDRDEARNAVIRAERLSPREVARLERSDPERFGALQAACAEILPGPPPAISWSAVSKVNPPRVKLEVLPPTRLCFSRTSTFCPFTARCAAAESPPIPAPMTITS